MAFRTVTTAVCLAFGMLFSSAAIGQTIVGDWQLQVDGLGTAFERRFALTPAQPFTGGEPKAILTIRRMKPDSPVELLVKATFDKEKEECRYRDWEIAVDGYEIPVSGSSVGSATAVLKTFDSDTRDLLWKLIREGSKLAVRVEQKCGWFFGDSKLKIHTFSLRGSSAAYDFLIGKGD